MKSRFTGPARARIQILHRWWRAHRPAAPGLFVQELRAALDQIRAMPESGSPFSMRGGVQIRRVLLAQTQQYVYYSVDRAAAVLLVHTVWGAARGRGPKL